ncbi:hypothetical protein [Ruminococcus difficilis]|uniref:Uncharacterized protein n=1 Tax=Ruminococcus difficilis TaxID=2763069 RepID=A0A934TZ22_9FIRM|nr:hypothetical protein [Ruminococcus difficilis]MBK6088187.1 hypothetical protein [Ruminococcus difficilis]
MKKSLRFISLLIAVVFMISGAVMVVCHAEPDNNAQPAQNDPQPAQNDPQPAQNDPQPAQNDQQTAQNDQSSGNNSYDTGNNGYDNQNNYNSGYESDYNSNYNSGSYDSGNVGTVEDNAPVYYGDPSNSNNYVVNSTESAAGSVSSSLYNSSGMSAEDAKPNEWSDITLDEKTVQTGVTDFSAIKENTKVEDNGYWILYVGYALLGLSVLGILYFIIATIAHRSAVKKAERLERRRSSSPSRSAAARMEERERYDEYEEAPRRRTSRYADEDEGYSRRSSSRSDTGEVYVPRRAAKR